MIKINLPVFTLYSLSQKYSSEGPYHYYYIRGLKPSAVAAKTLQIIEIQGTI